MQPSADYMLGVVGSSVLLGLVCGALWARQRDPHLLRWMASWLCAAGIRLHVMSVGFADLPRATDLVIALLYTGHVAWWLSGTRFLSGRSDPVWSPWISAGGVVALGAGLRLAETPTWLWALPPTVLLAIGFVWSAVLVFRQSAYGIGGWMAGSGLAAYAIHTLLTLPQYATGDFESAFFGERVLGVLLGVGLVFTHIDAAWERIHHREQMIAHADEGLLQLDLDGTPIEANPALARLLGCDDVAHVIESDLSPLVGSLRGGQAFERTVQWRRFDDDERVWLSLRMRPHRDAQGLPQGYQVHVQDSTESQQITERLQRAEKLNSLGRLAGGVSHDFNNVLAVIQGSLDLADHAMHDPERLQRVLVRARNATERGTHLTRRLLDFARHRPRRLEVVDLCQTAQQGLALLEQSIPHNVEVSFQGLGPALVTGDRGQFERVLMNLVLNGFDAMPQGGELDVIVTQHGDRVQLEVRDTGGGIPEEHEEHIFDPFFTTREGGTGLGLSTVFGIVTGAGGTIDVHSGDRGTRFVVELPATEAPTPGTSSRTPAPAPRRRTVLIADDETDVREVAAEMLAAAGYQVLQASDGLEALEVARISGYVDLLITDVVMPGMRGAELAEALQRNFEGLPVIFLSAYPQHTDPGLLQDQFRTFVPKPFRKDQLLRVVRRALTATSAG